VSLVDTKERVGGTSVIQNLYVFYPYVDSFASEKMKAWATLINKSFPEERVESSPSSAWAARSPSSTRSTGPARS
jgi:hypothetical protein